MNELYAKYPSNMVQRHLQIKMRKDPKNTFIGGLVIGFILGSLIGWTLLASIIAHAV